MDRVRISSDFGDIVLEYQTPQELEKKLGDIDKIAELVRTKAGSVAAATHIRQAKPGFEDIYRFLPDQSVELLVPVPVNVQKVALVLFAYDRALAPSLIERWTGIPEAVSKVIQAGPNRQYFTRLGDGSYTISSEGVTWLTKVVIPKLRGK